MNNKTYSQILDEVAHDQIPEGLDLAPNILGRIQKRKGKIMHPRVRTVVTILVILLVIAIVSVSVPAVRAAIQRWFGYVPGFGLVQEGGIRVLQAPASLTQEGFTLTVEEAILSSDKTVVRYTLDGLSTAMLLDTDPCSIFQAPPILRLPNGSELELRGYGTDYPTDPKTIANYGGEATYAAMPANVNKATLVITCLSQIDPTAVPGHWEVPLRFVPAPPEMTVMPVLEVPTTVEQPSGSGGLAIKEIVPIQGGYLLAGTLTVTPPTGYTVNEWDGYLEDVTITDADGQELPYGPAPIDFIPDGLAQPLVGSIGWACQVQGEDLNWPLTMKVRTVTAQTAPYPPAEFQFDAGPDPRVDQVWELNREIALGPKIVHLISVKRIQKDYGFDGYEFTFEFDASTGFSLEIAGHQHMGGGGGGPYPDGTFSLAKSYPDGIPSGILTVILNGYGIVRLPGPWQVTWTAPTP